MLFVTAASSRNTFHLSTVSSYCKRFFSEILSSMLTVPEEVRGITVLTEKEKKLFSKEVTLPIVMVSPKSVSRIIGCREIASRTVGRFCNKIKPVIDIPGENEKGILFCPEKMDGNSPNIIMETIEALSDSLARFKNYSVVLDYEDWPLKSCITAVLPEGLEFGGFSQIGHIVHVNLREELLLYKRVIGQLLLDKVNSCKTVVNKLDAIGHKYRTFELDLLAGEDNYKTEVHEEKLRYQLDFSLVFYNPRLSTEHKRIVKKIGKRSIFYDCCAGIGPFVLPAVRNGAHHILANDLNPNSIEFMKKNMELNHLSFERLETYNMDAAQFIKIVVANDLAKEALHVNSCDSKDNSNEIPKDAHVVMNLPGMSLQFLSCFRGCLNGQVSLLKTLPFPLYVHCHFFVKAPDDLNDEWYFEEARNLVRTSLGAPELDFIEIRFVRGVAGRKKMFCASFQVPDEILFAIPVSEVSLAEDKSQKVTIMEKMDDNHTKKGRTCTAQACASRQTEETEPETKKKKLESTNTL